MAEEHHHQSASDLLTGAINKNKADYISLADLRTSLSERSFGILMLIFAAPIWAMPPGLTAIFAIPLLLFGFQMLINNDGPWLPDWLEERKIKRSTLAHLIEKTSPYLKKIEKLLRPRFSFASSDVGEKIIGIFVIIFALSIMVPLPFTNLIPSIGVILMSLGLLSKDGITIIIGMVIGSGGVMLTMSVLLLGQSVVLKLFGI